MCVCVHVCACNFASALGGLRSNSFPELLQECLAFLPRPVHPPRHDLDRAELSPLWPPPRARSSGT
eukprot:13292980-Alexandrium_andersonii.AAC.1